MSHQPYANGEDRAQDRSSSSPQGAGGVALQKLMKKEPQGAQLRGSDTEYIDVAGNEGDWIL